MKVMLLWKPGIQEIDCNGLVVFVAFIATFVYVYSKIIQDMSDRVNARLSKPLAEHVNRMAGENGLYETPSEYVRSLIRRDMESDSSQIYSVIKEGFEDISEGRYFQSTGNWKKDKEAFQRKETGGWK